LDSCGDGVDQDCDTVADDGCPTTVDNDRDGFGVGGATVGQPDCDDGAARVYPGAEEACGDGIDNDCDGTVDDGCPEVDCSDRDGDGWGVGAGCTIADCDDDDAAVHPWAVEVCGDAKDNDCDTTVDDGCEGVDCVDADFDGWGVGSDCVRADCNDGDGGISPWVSEACGDGIDNDCSGSADEGCLICEDRDGDGHGIGPKCSAWDCNDADPKVFAGAEEICDYKDSNCDEVIPDGETECSAAQDEEGCSCQSTTPPSSLLLVLLLLAGLRWCRAPSQHRREDSRQTLGHPRA
jgi:MYXO-CTERM domain-containing protein